MQETERLLFLKYALPCAQTLIDRKQFSQEKFDVLLDALSRGVVPKDNPEKIFKVAFAICTVRALEQRTAITKKIIHDYYWFGHDAIVAERFELMRDFDPESCKTYPGRIVELNGKRVLVRTARGIHSYRSDLVSGLNAGDYVVVHRDFVVEKVSRKVALSIAKKTGKLFQKV